MKFVLVFGLMVLGGCSTKPNPASCADNHCSDPARPFCDEDGTIGGEPDTCIAVSCNPNEFEVCRDDRALMCNATGDNYDLVECMYGCSVEAGGCNTCNTPDCEKHIIPRYVPDICNELVGGDPLVISSSSTFDTTNALSCHSVVQQSSGPEICVLKRSVITVAANQTLRIIGTRAFALVADRDLKIEGIVDVSAQSGPFGAGTGAHGPGGGDVSGAIGDPSIGSGGGGAGFKTMGGNGGTRTVTGGAANGGSAAMNPADISYLIGGTAPPRAGGSLSGFAGGALTLVSCRGTVSVSGMIDANGGGGSGGYVNNLAQHFPAGGGGSGGHVVLQGMNIVILGEMYANGGGGGAGENPNQLNQQFGDSGQKGQRSTSPALGGPGANGGGSGGRGGTGTFVPFSGLMASVANGMGGAGGGSAGFLQTYTPADVNPVITPSAVSPELQGNRAIPTN